MSFLTTVTEEAESCQCGEIERSHQRKWLPLLCLWVYERKPLSAHERKVRRHQSYLSHDLFKKHNLQKHVLLRIISAFRVIFVIKFCNVRIIRVSLSHHVLVFIFAETSCSLSQSSETWHFRYYRDCPLFIHMVGDFSKAFQCK